MKKIAERRIVVVLFVLVFITFSFAHEDSKKIEQVYSGEKVITAVDLTASQNTIPDNPDLEFSKIQLKKK
jgi:hypothetical protein